MNQKTSKNILRRKIITKRKCLGIKPQQRASRSISIKLIKLQHFKKSLKIGLYLAANGEISLDYVINWANRFTKSIYVPVITSPQQGKMQMVKLDNHDLKLNRLNILEPQNFNKISKISCLDVLLVPLVAFDQQGNRLGMGGGFYDRALSKIRCKSKPLTIGIAHRMQQVRRIPHKRHDIKLAQVITN